MSLKLNTHHAKLLFRMSREGLHIWTPRMNTGSKLGTEPATTKDGTVSERTIARLHTLGFLEKERRGYYDRYTLTRKGLKALEAHVRPEATV